MAVMDRYREVTEKFDDAMEALEDFATVAEGFIINLLREHDIDEFIFEGDIAENFERIFIDDDSDSLMVVDAEDEDIVVDFRQGLASPFDQIGIVDAVLINFGYKLDES